MTDPRFVPEIYKKLKESGPSFIVYILETLFPGVMMYTGNLSLKEICNGWIDILENKQKPKE